MDERIPSQGGALNMIILNSVRAGISTGIHTAANDVQAVGQLFDNVTRF